MPDKSVASPALLSVDDALAQICDGLPRLPAQTLPLQAAHGRILAAPFTAALSLPAHAVSAMDGYAVRAADITTIPATLTRSAESAAGHPSFEPVGPGQAVRIFTGAVVPPGADSIILQEDVTATAEADGARITLHESPRPGRFIRPAGLDVKAGDNLLDAGLPLSARALALALATGNQTGLFAPRPRIGILSTGDELVLPGQTPGPGQIISSNAAFLTAFITACGAEALDLGIVPDRPGAMLAALRGAPVRPDLLVTTGGASVGVHDHIVSDLDGDGSLCFWKIAMRPGKPLIFGKVDDVPLLGLPGNPVSSAVCAMVFLRPAMARMAGTPYHPQLFSARLATSLAANDQRQDYLRATLSETDAALPLITPAPRQDSSMISVLAKADALLVRPPFAAAANPGDVVTAMSIPALL